MENEHCSLGRCEHNFATGSKKRQTCPAKEWDIAVHGKYNESDLCHSRRPRKIAELVELDLVKRAETGLMRGDSC